MLEPGWHAVAERIHRAAKWLGARGISSRTEVALQRSLRYCRSDPGLVFLVKYLGGLA